MPISFWLRKVTKTASGQIGPYLTHSGVVGHQNHLCAGRAMPISFWLRKVTKTASGQVGAYLTHSGVVGHQNNFWAGRAVFIPFRRRKVTKTASGQVGPYLTHYGVVGHQNHFWAGRGCVYLIPASKSYPDRFRAGQFFCWFANQKANVLAHNCLLLVKLS
jgi:hypothetical protein